MATAPGQAKLRVLAKPSPRWLSLALLSIVSLVGCSAPGPSSATGAPGSQPPSGPDGSPTTAPTVIATPPTSPAPDQSIVVGGDRPVTVYIPSGYDPLTPAPLLIVLHGYTDVGAIAEERMRFAPVADAHGMLYAYPDGSIDSRGDHFWNASRACCNFHDSTADDSTYLAGLVNEIGSALSLDRSRVYFAGHSNGGFMSYRMACDHSDIVAGVASLAGSTPLDDECEPSQPVAVLQVHGTADDTVLYEGGSIMGAPYPGARETVTTWAEYDGCDGELTQEPDRLDLDADLEVDGLPAETTVERTAGGCRGGGYGELWTIEGGGHVPNLTGTFAEAVVRFLLAHPKP